VKIALIALVLVACNRAESAPPQAKLPAPEPAVVSVRNRVVHTEPSEFGDVVVVERGDHRYLRFDAPDASDDQSMISISDPEAVPMDYIRFATIGAAYTPEVKRLLMVGLGGGTFTTMLHRVRAELLIDVAEINPVVVRVAKKYFRVKPDQRYRIHVEDGARFVDGVKEPYDLIMLDAYSGDGIPEHLRTSDWFAAVAAKLHPAGALVINLSMEGTVEREMVGRVREHLPALACFRTVDTLNLIVVARRNPAMPDQAALEKRAGELNAAWMLPFDLREAARQLDPGCAAVAPQPGSVGG